YPRPPPIQVSTHRTEGLVSSARWDKPVEINFHRFFLLAITNDERSRIAQFLSYRAGRTPGGHSLEAGNERCAAHGGIGLSSASAFRRHHAQQSGVPGCEIARCARAA